ncbi:uncharacterized protein PG998_011200 [Apiospora kogelbergensis]|uniref:CCHC-type domain-containing protein n=1 Tax=Apiospora kogelbergensis TaxID=1337665 RepID=A0AAW0RCB0_9PEZI
MEPQMTPPAISPGISDTTLCSPSILDDSEHWESLQALSVVLQKGLSLHRNGPAQVRMSEQSLYNLVAAGEKDFLEIIVRNVSGPSDSKSSSSSSSSSSSTATCQERSQTPPKGIINAAPRPRLSRRSRSIKCGNCNREGHTIRDCVGPVDEGGRIDGCPKCNLARAHIYDDCPLRDSAEDFDYIYRFRQRKPPIKSWMSWECFIGHDTKYTSWPRYIPWSADFAWDQQSRAFLAHRSPEWLHYEYEYIDMPDEEASLREIDPDSEFLAL